MDVRISQGGQLHMRALDGVQLRALDIELAERRAKFVGRVGGTLAA